jgi:alkanesulfonate monooxygenase SsuD/methylene tetrahydromethanopterin reductase-like flavin-dependent oxidoreductase (luciferase family)
VFGIAGTPSECHDRLQEYLATGLDEVVIGISGDVAANRSGLKLLREHNLLA